MMAVAALQCSPATDGALFQTGAANERPTEAVAVAAASPTASGAASAVVSKVAATAGAPARTSAWPPWVGRVPRPSGPARVAAPRASVAPLVAAAIEPTGGVGPALLARCGSPETARPPVPVKRHVVATVPHKVGPPEGVGARSADAVGAAYRSGVAIRLLALLAYVFSCRSPPTRRPVPRPVTPEVHRAARVGLEAVTPPSPDGVLTPIGVRGPGVEAGRAARQ